LVIRKGTGFPFTVASQPGYIGSEVTMNAGVVVAALS
jgi:UDP-N-acetylenolpyruvoylglucosamine reductase